MSDTRLHQAEWWVDVPMRPGPLCVAEVAEQGEPLSSRFVWQWATDEQAQPPSAGAGGGVAWSGWMTEPVCEGEGS